MFRPFLPTLDQMRQPGRFLGIIALVLVLGGISTSHAQPASRPRADANITCGDPATLNTTTGEELAGTLFQAELGDPIVVDILVQNVTDLYGADVIATFNTGIAQVVDQDGGTSGVQIQVLNYMLEPGFVLFKSADNAAGQIHYGNTQLNPEPPKSGSKPLARITFSSVTYGQFNMNFTLHQLGYLDGTEIPSTSTSCIIRYRSPLAVQLARFDALSADSHVLLAWETVSEQHNQGFHIERSTTQAGPWQRITNHLIPAQQPGASAGHEYEWKDFGVAFDQHIYYRLVAVETGGTTEVVGMTSVGDQTRMRWFLPYVMH